MRKTWTFIALAVVVAFAGSMPAAQQVQEITGELQWSSVRRITCRLTTTATTSTAITGCAAPGAGVSIYVTDIGVYGGVANVATEAAIVQSGTGGTCGTATVIQHYCQHQATAGCEARMITPKKLAANSELCLLDPTVGSKFITVSGYIAP